MTRRRSHRVALTVVLATLAAGAANGQQVGRLTGGEKYEIPEWFTQSFLDIADDAAEAAEADQHAMLFIHSDECPYCALMLRESIDGSENTPWLRERFNAIAINTRGDREVVFNEEITVTEKELAQALAVRQTPSIIFLDGSNKPVLRSDGYRTPKDFKRILDYVDSKSYLTTDLSSFIAKTEAGSSYHLRAHSSFANATDLSTRNRPVMVIFEDRYCDACDLMHDTLLKDVTVNELMRQLTVIRLDAESETSIVTPAGERTTPRAWLRELGILARPAIVLMDGSDELVRIAGVLRRFHFQTALRYVAEGRYREYPSLRDFSRAYQEQLLAAGQVIDVGVQ